MFTLLDPPAQPPAPVALRVAVAVGAADRVLLAGAGLPAAAADPDRATPEAAALLLERLTGVRARWAAWAPGWVDLAPAGVVDGRAGGWRTATAVYAAVLPEPVPARGGAGWVPLHEFVAAADPALVDLVAAALRRM